MPKVAQKPWEKFGGKLKSGWVTTAVLPSHTAHQLLHSSHTSVQGRHLLHSFWGNFLWFGTSSCLFQGISSTFLTQPASHLLNEEDRSTCDPSTFPRWNKATCCQSLNHHQSFIAAAGCDGGFLRCVLLPSDPGLTWAWLWEWDLLIGHNGGAQAKSECIKH